MSSPLQYTLGARLGAFLQSTDDLYKYRAHLSNRIAGLRKTLKLKSRVGPDGYKGLQKLINLPNSTFVDPELGPKLIQLYLSLAERDWIHALEVKSVLEVNPSKRRGNYMLLKLSHTRKYATILAEQLEAQRGSTENPQIRTTDVLEVYVYGLIAEGQQFVSRNNFKSALKSFCTAYIALITLQKHTNSESCRDLYKDICDSEVTEPLKFVAFRNPDTRGLDINSVARSNYNDSHPSMALVALMDPAFVSNSNGIFRYDPKSASEDSEEMEIDSEITWRGHTASLESRDEVAYCIARARKLQAALNAALQSRGPVAASEAAELFDPLQQEWQEALEIHRQEMARAEVLEISDETQSDEILLTMIQYNVYFHRIHRDFVLTDSLRRKLGSEGSKLELARELCKLYDMIEQTVAQVAELPGVYSDDELWRSLESAKLFISASKATELARAYKASDAPGKFRVALALTVKARKILSDVAQPGIIVDFPVGGYLSDERINKLKTDVNNEEKQLLALTYHEQCLAAQEAQVAQHPALAASLLEDSEKYPVGTCSGVLTRLAANVDVANGEMTVRPIMPKPVLFDIGFNYTDLETGAENVAEKVAEKSGAVDKDGDNGKKKGFFGIW